MTRTGLFIALLILISYVVSPAQTHFVAPAGNPFSPMNIFIIGLHHHGENLSSKDEIAVMDGDLVVGAAIFTGGMLSPASPLEIRATKDDGTDTTANGFQEGNEIKFKFWDASEKKEYDIEPGEIQFHHPETGDIVKPVPFTSLGTAAVTIKGVTASAIDRIENMVPSEFALEQNYPNPFNPVTHFSFYLPRASQVLLQVYDMKGALVNTVLQGERGKGHYQVTWDGTNNSGIRVASGLYFYRLSSESFTATRKMILSK